MIPSRILSSLFGQGDLEVKKSKENGSLALKTKVLWSIGKLVITYSWNRLVF